MIQEIRGAASTGSILQMANILYNGELGGARFTAMESNLLKTGLCWLMRLVDYAA